MKPFIGFEIGAGAEVNAVHWGEAVDEAVAGLGGSCRPLDDVCVHVGTAL